MKTIEEAQDDENTLMSNDSEILSTNGTSETILPEFSTESTTKLDLIEKKDSKYNDDMYYPYYSHNRPTYNSYNRCTHYTHTC